MTAWEAIKRKHAPEIILALESGPGGLTKSELVKSLGDVCIKNALLTLTDLVRVGLVVYDDDAWCTLYLTPTGRTVAEHLRAIREAVQ